MTKFLRRTSSRYSKLGLRRKKKQVWRNPTGRHNKMREMRRGYPAVISVGYKADKKTKGTLNGKKPVIVHNLKELEKSGKNHIAIVGRVGKKRKIELLKKAKEMKIEVYKINIEKFLQKNEIKNGAKK